jgi:hypothetical protein
MNNLLKRIFTYDLSAAISCIFIPFILLIGDGPRESISNYAYSGIDFIYVFLLTVAATLITTIGVRKNQKLTWILGLCLMLIPLTPHLALPVIHTIVSAIFFGGMSFHIIKYSNAFKKFRWFLVGVMITCFALFYLTNIFTLFAVESIALVIFGVNFFVDLFEERRDLN